MTPLLSMMTFGKLGSWCIHRIVPGRLVRPADPPVRSITFGPTRRRADQAPIPSRMEPRHPGVFAGDGGSPLVDEPTTLIPDRILP